MLIPIQGILICEDWMVIGRIMGLVLFSLV